jgi:TIR domain
MRDDKSPVLFVSHHSSKLQTAEHVERALNARGIQCWIAPRDVEPGEQFDRAVHKAIGETDAMLLLFCSKSEKSRHVKRELILADQLNKSIIPLRLERIDPGELSYHLADSQWIDWLEQRDDVIERIAAKAREFHDEGGGPGAVSLVTPVGGGSMPDTGWQDKSALRPGWSSSPPSDDATPPIDLPDAAPAHSSAVGAAADLQPHAVGSFAGPVAPAFPPVPEGGRKRSMMWLWLTIGGVLTAGVVALILVLTMRGSSPAASGGLTAEWFAGVWADSRDCREPFRFDRSGQVTYPTGAQGNWTIENGNTLVIVMDGQRYERALERVNDDEIRGARGSTYRCFPGAT